MIGFFVATAKATLPPADFTFANGAEPSSLDPVQTTGTPEARLLRAIFEGLVVLDPKTLAAVPGMAESWTVSSDELTYSFRVRAGSRWTNGDEVTAFDFRDGFERLLDPREAAEYAYLLYEVRGARAFATDVDERGAPRLGFDTGGLLTFEVRFPPGDFLQRRGTVAGLPYFEINPPPSIAFERMYRVLKAVPGAESVAGVSTQLLNSLVIPSATISLDGRRAHDSKENGGPAASFAIGVGANASHLDERRTPIAAYFLVTPDFFTAIRSAKLRGRDFNEHDTAGGEWVAIINESAARRFWPESDPLGQTFTILNSPEERPRRVIGIVRDIPLTREGEYRPAVYTSYLQQPSMYPAPGANVVGQMVFMMRSAGDPMSLLPAARRVVSEVDSDRPLVSVATMEQRLRFVVPQRGFVVLAITAFALTATLLAAIGIYGVIAWSVTQRTREIAFASRSALGRGK